MQLSRANRKAIRTLLQCIVGAISTGGLNILFGGLDPAVLAVIGIVLTTILTQVQNSLEASDTIPTLLPTQPPPATNLPVIEPVDG